MKKLLTIVLLLTSLVVNGASYYVSTLGNDNNNGSIGSPWATWQKGFSSIAAGDTLFIRGGTYSPTATTGTGDGGTTYCGVYISAKHGTSGAHYTVKNYPGEIPILSGTNITNIGARSGILLNSCNYWHLKGLKIQSVNQHSSGSYYSHGIELFSGNNNTIEFCSVTLIGGPGYKLRTPDGNNNTFFNCDAYACYDQYSGGGDADGFDIGFCLSDYSVYLTGCRSWNNSDDGFDMYQYTGYSGIYYLNGCWAFHNGYRSDQVTPAGDGCGFKYGADGQTYTTTYKRYTTNCIAYDNRTRGFSQESANVRKQFFNNISMGNDSYGYSFGWSGDGSDLETGDLLRNNIAFGDGIQSLHGTIVRATRISDHNSWDNGAPTITNADFFSVTSELSASRDSYGTLPVMTFLHPVSTSDILGAGVTVSGVVLDGDGNNYLNPPTLGPFEYYAPGGSAELPTISTNPVSNITISSAISGGNVTDDGGAIVTERGIVWATTAEPTVDTYLGKFVNGIGTGNFSCQLTNLQRATIYHVRAYAINSEGTQYGLELVFRTPGNLVVVY